VHGLRAQCNAHLMRRVAFSCLLPMLGCAGASGSAPNSCVGFRGLRNMTAAKRHLRATRGRYLLHGVAPGATCNCGVRPAVHQYWRPKLCNASRPSIQGRELGRQGAPAALLTWRSITCKLPGTCIHFKDIRLSSLEQHAARVTSEQTPAGADHVVRRARSLVQGLSPAVTPTHTETHSPSQAALR